MHKITKTGKNFQSYINLNLRKYCNQWTLAKTKSCQ